MVSELALLHFWVKLACVACANGLVAVRAARFWRLNIKAYQPSLSMRCTTSSKNTPGYAVCFLAHGGCLSVTRSAAHTLPDPCVDLHPHLPYPQHHPHVPCPIFAREMYVAQLQQEEQHRAERERAAMAAAEAAMAAAGMAPEGLAAAVGAAAVGVAAGAAAASPNYASSADAVAEEVVTAVAFVGDLKVSHVKLGVGGLNCRGISAFKVVSW